MKQIPLSQGKFALVDDEDYDFIMQWKWSLHTGGYAVRRDHLGTINGKEISKMIYMHCVINNTAKGIKTDHRDSNGLNNQRYNLRDATSAQNVRYQRKTRGSSKYKGVHWCKNEKKWKAQICANGRFSLGTYCSENEAALAYNNAAIKYHGEFALLNQID